MAEVEMNNIAIKIIRLIRFEISIEILPYNIKRFWKVMLEPAYYGSLRALSIEIPTAAGTSLLVVHDIRADTEPNESLSDDVPPEPLTSSGKSTTACGLRKRASAITSS